jgi:hypothetical protein
METESNKTEKVEKSSRIMAWSKFLRALSLLIWSVIGFIILGYGGYYFFLKDTLTPGRSPAAQERPREARLPPIYSDLDKAVAQALEEARSEARTYALGQLDQWEKELRHRVDTDFLGWYFGYWTSQIRGAKALFDGVKNWVASDQPTAQEQLTEEFQREFTIRVLQPKTSQLQLERIQRETLVKFLSHFKRALDEIPKKYKVSAPEWEKYINDVSQQSSLVEAGRQVPITLKAIYAASVGGSVAIAAKILSSFKGGVSSGVATKLAGKMGGKMGAKIAAKTGGKVAGKLGGEFLGPIVGVGIIAWDVWDHYSTVKENKPLLRDNIFAFLDEMKLAVLDDPGTGVMSPVYQIEEQLKNSLAATQRSGGSQGNPVESQPE